MLLINLNYIESKMIFNSLGKEEKYLRFFAKKYTAANHHDLATAGRRYNKKALLQRLQDTVSLKRVLCRASTI